MSGEALKASYLCAESCLYVDPRFFAPDSTGEKLAVPGYAPGAVKIPRSAVTAAGLYMAVDGLEAKLHSPSNAPGSTHLWRWFLGVQSCVSPDLRTHFMLTTPPNAYFA